jgi:predicted nucleic-acid-binding protein
MPALDTNVLVRWLTRDDEAQYAVAGRKLAAARQQGQSLWVAPTVLLELEWVLRSRYRVGRVAMASTFDALLQVHELSFGEEVAVERALWRFKRDDAPDFADCLHASLAEGAGQGPLLTFDTRAATMPGAQAI